MQAGVCNAVAMWFQLHLDEEVSLSTSPYQDKGPTWQQVCGWLHGSHCVRGCFGCVLCGDSGPVARQRIRRMHGCTGHKAGWLHGPHCVGDVQAKPSSTSCTQQLAARSHILAPGIRAGRQQGWRFPLTAPAPCLRLLRTL